MTAKVGALPPTYQHDRSESGNVANCPCPGGRMTLFPSKELPTDAMPARGISTTETAAPHSGIRRERVTPVAAAGKTDPFSPLVRLWRCPHENIFEKWNDLPRNE